MERYTLCIPTLFGLEGLVGDEMRRMQMQNVRVEDRRVFFEGTAADIARANLRCRMGERVMILLARFPVHSFEDLYQGVKKIPLEAFIGKEDAFPVKGYSLDSQLHSVPDCQAIAKKAAVDRLGAHYHLSWLPETGPVHQLRFSIMKDQCEIFLDTSGVSLHKRGYRAEANLAPLHETMAAAMVNAFPLPGPGFLLGSLLRLRDDPHRSGADRAEPGPGPAPQLRGPAVGLSCPQRSGSRRRRRRRTWNSGATTEFSAPIWTRRTSRCPRPTPPEGGRRQMDPHSQAADATKHAACLQSGA